MGDLGWPMHIAIFLALVVNLWFGGDFIEAWFHWTGLGHVVRSALEIALIGAWLILVIGMRAPWPWWPAKRRPPEDGDRDRRP